MPLCSVRVCVCVLTVDDTISHVLRNTAGKQRSSHKVPAAHPDSTQFQTLQVPKNCNPTSTSRCWVWLYQAPSDCGCSKSRSTTRCYWALGQDALCCDATLSSYLGMTVYGVWLIAFGRPTSLFSVCVHIYLRLPMAHKSSNSKTPTV